MKRKIILKLGSVLLSIGILIFSSISYAAFWGIPNSVPFVRNGMPGSIGQRALDPYHQGGMGATYPNFITLKIGSTHTFLYTTPGAYPVGINAKRNCFPITKGIANPFCAVQSSYFDINPNGNFEYFNLADTGCLLKCGSPLIIDMRGNGIELGSQGVGVSFDIDADGRVDDIQWVKSGGDEVFLALDLNANGSIDDGNELFGTGTSLLKRKGKKADNGFIALSQYDRLAFGGNGDFKITAEDQIWASLILWQDINSDGLSTPNEIKRLVDSKLTELGTVAAYRDVYDDSTNWLPLWASAVMGKNRSVNLVDVFFRLL